MLRFVNWCAAVQGLHVHALSALDAQSEELVVRYLDEGRAAGKSAWTLKTERSAFRLFFGQRDLAAGVPLPLRRRADIQRSRRPAVRDRSFDPSHWRQLLTFLEATGLRRSEVAHIHVRDLVDDADGRLHVAVKGKGGRWRTAPVLDQYAREVRALLVGKAPDERVFTRIPSHLDVHASRRRFAQETYRQAGGDQVLPSSTGRLPAGAVVQPAAHHVSRALGHSRDDVTISHYLR